VANREDMMVCFPVNLLRRDLQAVMKQIREVAAVVDRLYDGHGQRPGPLRAGLLEAVNDLDVARELLGPWLASVEQGASRPAESVDAAPAVGPAVSESVH
jgi:hypothetical protein